MVEMLIAIFVVAVGVLGTVSALWYGIRSERNSARRGDAAYQGRELMNLIRSRNLPFIGTFPAIPSELNDGNIDNDSDDNGPRRAFNAPPFANDFPSNPFNFERRIEMKVLSTDPNNHLSSMAAIKVTVFWIDGGSRKESTTWAFHRRP